MFLLLMWVGSGCVSFSPPIYSPDHQKAARVETDDEGATGGNTTVELFESHCWREQAVYSGGWRSVEPDGIHWLDNSHLRIEYNNTSDHQCDPSPRIVIECAPRLEQVR
ncbi:MAG TPA: hypothetical protein VGJ21_06860 [Terracidiphilus sp.]